MTLLLELLLTITLIVVCDGFQVTLYSSTHQSGKLRTIDVNSCVNLNDHKLCGYFSYNLFSAITCHFECCSWLEAADNVESIDTHNNCVRVYRGYDCKEMVGPRIEPGSDCHSDWGDSGCGFKNDIRSISPCDGHCIHPASRLTRRSSNRCEVHKLRDDNPIYVTFYNVQGVKVPEFLETYLFNTFDGRTEFQGGYWAMRFRSMFGRAGIDARGHLLASSLGGKAEDWNFAPQRTEINNGDGTGQGWKSLELQIRNHLKAEPCNYVYWQQAIEYFSIPRPEAFFITAHFFETWYNQLVDVKKVTVLCHNNIDIYPGVSFCETNTQPYPDGRP